MKDDSIAFTTSCSTDAGSLGGRCQGWRCLEADPGGHGDQLVRGGRVLLALGVGVDLDVERLLLLLRRVLDLLTIAVLAVHLDLQIITQFSFSRNGKSALALELLLWTHHGALVLSIFFGRLAWNQTHDLP